MRLLLAALLILPACSEDPPDPVQVPDAGPIDENPPLMARLVVLDKLAFTGEVEEGVAPGWDLDDRISDEYDEETCGHADYTAPDGTEGVDNKLASIVPLFELVGIGAAEGLIQDSIEDGGLLLMMEVTGVDDPVDDDDVQVMVRAGHGTPLLGTDGKLLAGQTFHLHPESPDSVAQRGSIKDGVLTAGPFEAHLPVVVFGMRYDLTFLNARLRGDWTEDGGLQNGLFGGSVTIEEIYTIGEVAAADDASVLSSLKAILQGAGDLDPDPETGLCRQISATLSFTAVSAFFFPGEE